MGFQHIERLLSFAWFRVTGKEERKKERRKKEETIGRTKSKFSCSIFSTMRRSHGILGLYFCIKIAKGFIYMYKSFVSLLCVYLRAALIPQVQDAILNLPNLYLRGTTVPLDIYSIYTIPLERNYRLLARYTSKGTGKALHPQKHDQ